MRTGSFSEDSEAPAEEIARRSAAASRTTWVSVFVNMGMATAQIAIGVLARSQALIADGLHSLSDLVSDAVVLVASHQSRKDADDDHPYGHQRFETGASLVLGLILLAVGLLMVTAAIAKLQQPPVQSGVHPIALVMALVALVSKELLFRYMLRVAKQVKSSLLVANAWHARSDAASSLVVSIGILGSLFGYPILDPIAALIVGFMVAKMGWSFGWNALHDLMDRSADADEVIAIRQTITSTPGVISVHDVRARRMGDMIVADAHIEVAADITVEAGHDIAVEARRRVMQRHRVLNLMTHVDPSERPDRDHAAQG